VDLLVVVPHTDDKRALVAEIRRAVVHLPVAKDIIVATPDDVRRYGKIVGTVLYPALRDGKVLYDRGSQNAPDHQEVVATSSLKPYTTQRGGMGRRR
jgi:hypothetical protein